MRKAYTICALIALTLAATPAFADTIYLPFVVGGSEGANRIMTKVWVSNPSDDVRRFSTYFIPSGEAAADPREDRPQITVPAGALRVVEVTQSASGVLELTGAPQLRYSARLEVRTPGGQLLSSTRVPLVGSENMIFGGDPIQLQPLERRLTGSETDLGILNLSPEVNRCQITYYRASGAPVAPGVTITVPALGLRFFDEIFGEQYLDQEAIADARLQVVCDAEFYAYSTITDRGNGEVLFVTPADPGNSELVAPGDEPPVPNGTVFFERSGTFLNSTTSAARAAFDIPAEANRFYQRAVIDFDFRFARYTNPLFHTLSSMRGGGIWYVVTLRADRNRTILETSANGSAGEGGPWTRGQTYHVKMILDVGTRTTTMRVTQGNQLVQELSHPLGRNSLAVFSGNKLVLDFSQDKVYDDAFFPLWGSQFSNLRVTMEPVSDGN